MKTHTILAIVKEPGKKARAHYVENTLEELQGIVGDYLEAVTINDQAVILCDEEGKLKGLEPNFGIARGTDGIIITDPEHGEAIIVGPAIIVGVHGDEFADLDLWDFTELLEQIYAVEKKEAR